MLTMKSPITVLDGFTEPAEASYALIASIYRSSGAFVQSLEEAFPDVDAFKEYLAALRRRPGAVFMVAKNEQEGVGYLFVEPRPIAKLAHTADLNMSVAANARGLGVGGHMLDAAFDHIAQQQVIEIMYLMVRADNTAGRKLYAAKGFDTVAVLERDTRACTLYFDGVLMRRFFELHL